MVYFTIMVSSIISVFSCKIGFIVFSQSYLYWLIILTTFEFLKIQLGGGMSVQRITETTEQVITITDLAPFAKYRITLQAQNYLYNVDNTTVNSANISVKLLEGGKAFMYQCFIYTSLS